MTNSNVVSFNKDGSTNSTRKETERRVAWTGMTEVEAERPGAELLAALFQKANEDGLNLRELAASVDVTYGYIHQLKTGLRATPQVSDEFLTSCARYLRKSKKHVSELSGKVSFADEYLDSEIDGDLDTAFGVMQRDTTWGGNLPLSLKSLCRKERLFIVKLYEAATGKRLLPDASL